VSFVQRRYSARLALIETFGKPESVGWLRAASTAVDVDGSDSELIPVTRCDVTDLR